MQNKFIQHLIAVVTFLVLAAAFNAPVFSGKTLDQNDIKQHEGSAAEVVKFRENNDRQILWTNVMFSGMPTYLISALYSGEVLRHIPGAVNAVLNHTIGYIFLLMIGFYLLSRSLNVDYRLGIFGAIAYGFSTYFIIVLAAGHNSKIHAMAYLPAILAGMIWAYEHKRLWLGAGVFTFFLGLELSARHPQMFYYFLFLAIPYGIYNLVKAFRGKELPYFLKATALLLVGAALGVMSNLPYLMNTYEFGKQTIRGKSELTLENENKTEGLDRDYATAWSYGVGETFTLLFPNFKGGASEAIGANEKALEDVDPRFKQTIAGQRSYFGDQPFTSGPVYAGAVVMLLVLLSFFFLKGSFKYLLLGIMILTVALSWGKNFEGLTNFFLDNVPFYNKFRAVASILVIPEIILPLLAMLALSALSQIKDWKEEVKLLVGGRHSKQKLLYYAAGALLTFIALNLIAPGLFNSFLTTQEAESLNQRLLGAGYNQAQASGFIDGLEGARQSIFKADVLRSFLFVALASGLLVLFQRGMLKQGALIVSMAILVLIDLFPVNKRYLNEDNFVNAKGLENNYGVQPTPADLAIMGQYQSDDPYFRTLNLTVSPFNNASTSFFHYSLGGYHGAKLKIYQEFIDYQLGSEIEMLKQSLQQQQFSPAMFAQMPGMRMLNARYVIVNPQAAPVENRARLGNAWLVQNVKEVATANDEIKAVGTIDPATTAVLRKSENAKVGPLPANAGQGRITLKSYDPEKLVYSYQGTGENLAMFSEIWYPNNWVATVGGHEVPIIRANYLLRSLKLPAGQHEIVFEYVDKASGTANSIALASSILLLLALPVVIIVDRKRAANKAGTSN
jgi:hypothetical protein